MSQASIETVEAMLRESPRRWLITGFAGFIGSHLCEHLLALGQYVIGLDNFSTGTPANIEAAVRGAVARGAADADSRLFVVEADVRDFDGVLSACEGVDHVLHHAAIASVPRTIEEPLDAYGVNVDGSFYVLESARRVEARSVVLASSSAVYGDYPGDPDTGAQVEGRIGRPLSPYAAHKHVAEILGQATARAFGVPSVALRYFNIVGARQDPEGAYAAVIPKWVALLARGEQPAIYGDGHHTRDFCPVEDVVQANLLAATWPERATGEADPCDAVFNIGLGRRTSLLELYDMIHAGMLELGAPCEGIRPRHEDPRPGDIVHSLADITRAREQLGYAPRTSMEDALRATMKWLL
jgi:UDP-N-acetylglucosamine 4-epimerase